MKGDFTRDTFRPEKYFQQVLMQQGRVQLDADWNEQGAIVTRRDETMLADLAGECGGPAEGAAFAVITDPAELSAMPADPNNPIRQFGLSAGRYYVQGRQCEVYEPCLFAWQPSLRSNTALPPGDYLIYLDVWQRHVTLLEDPSIRETALGGPDTGTRLKTIWQVRAAALDALLDLDNSLMDPCGQPASDFARRQRAQLPSLAARVKVATPDAEPCTVPASAGYRGLENQLYRVEIHSSGDMGSARFKWSRENGAVVTRVTDNAVLTVNGANVNRLTVHGTGPDEALGFKTGNLVEVLHEHEELEGLPGTLARVDVVDDSTGTITLAQFESEPMPVTIDLHSNPRLRRWEGLGSVASDATVNDGYLSLESGIEVRFDQPAEAEFRTSDYWQIPARTATPDAQSGTIEWPAIDDQPVFLPPKGIQHHYCRLGVVSIDAGGAVTAISDCRCLWPALTAVPRLFYVGGDGQEVMPDLTAPGDRLYKLPRPLIVGVANSHCLIRPHAVLFEIVNTAQSPGTGRVVVEGGTPTGNSVVVPLDSQGLARCDFHLDGVNPTQQVTARLLDHANQPVSLPIIFSARLSIASQVAYQPSGCIGLSGQRTVQNAISQLAELISLYKISGDGQQGPAGAHLQPLVVLAANRCGPVANMRVTFKVLSGGGSITPSSAATNQQGFITCDWQLGSETGMQEVEAELSPIARQATTEPRRVRFVAQLTEANNDPAPVRVVGLEFGPGKKPLSNDQTMPLSDLAAGVSLLCDRIIDRDTVLDPRGVEQNLVHRGQPTCFVTAEVPFPITNVERQEWEGIRSLAAYRPFILHARVDVEILSDAPPVPGDRIPRSRIHWQPDKPALEFLARVLQLNQSLVNRPDRVLLRLTLKGNFIWNIQARELLARGTVGGFLDGDTFRTPDSPNLLLPSGDSRRGGDFEMWFWLSDER